MTIEGGNELLGKHTFTIYNGLFKQENLGGVYTNYFQFKTNDYVAYGATLPIHSD